MNDPTSILLCVFILSTVHLFLGFYFGRLVAPERQATDDTLQGIHEQIDGVLQLVDRHVSIVADIRSELDALEDDAPVTEVRPLIQRTIGAAESFHDRLKQSNTGIHKAIPNYTHVSRLRRRRVKQRPPIASSASSLADVRSAIQLLVQQELQRSQVTDERRQAQRVRVNRPVHVTPLDEHGQPVGDRFETSLRDISNSGLSLFHTRVLYAPYAMLELELNDGSGIDVVMETIRCNAVGRMYVIAGKFVFSAEEGRPLNIAAGRE